MEAVWKLGTLRKDASAIEYGTEGVESLGFDHSRVHYAVVLSAWNKDHGSTLRLLVPFEDQRICVGHKAHSILVWLEVLVRPSPLLWREHPVGHVRTVKDIGNQLSGDATRVISPGPVLILTTRRWNGFGGATKSCMQLVKE